MTSGINLKRIRVSGWKAIREPIEIGFDGGSWLIHGENEVGKSSIFSSIRFALFEYPDTSGAYARSWVNNASPEAEVEVELLIDGKPYTIHKVRSQKGSGTTRLFDGIGDSRSERTSGKDAANDVLELVGAGKRSGRADEMPGDWGILAWLLAPQGMDSVSSAREHATQDLGLERAVSPEMISVQEALDASLAAELTPGGKKGERSPKKGGALRNAMDAVDAKVRENETLETRRVEYTEKLQELARTVARAEKNRAELEKASAAYAEQQDAKVDVAKLEGEIGELKVKVKAQETEVAAFQKAVETLSGIQGEATGHEEALRSAVEGIAVKVAEKSSLDEDIKKLDQRVQENSGELAKKKVGIDEKKGLIIESQRAQRLADLGAKVERLDAIEADITKLNEGGESLDAAGVGQLEILAGDLEQADAMLRSLAKTGGVSVVLDGELDAQWVVDGQAVELDPETRFARELVITGEGFSVTLSQEATDDTDWIRQRSDGLDQLKQLGLTTTDELRGRIRSERKRAERLRDLASEKSILGNREALAEEIARAPEMSKTGEKDLPDITVLEAEIEGLEEEEKLLQADSEADQKSLESLRTDNEKIGDDLKLLRADEDSSRTLLDATTKRRDREIEQAGTLETRKKDHAKCSDALVDLKKNLGRREELKTTEENAQKTEVKKAFRVKGQLEREQRSLDAEVISLRRACESLGGEGLHRERIALDHALETAKRDRDQIQCRVDAEERLRHRFQTALTAATELEIGPIKDQVEEWLAQVTEGRWTRVEMDSQLDVTMIEGPDRTIPGEKVGSAGLQQLIHALIRLAVAVNIHQGKSAENPDFPAVALVMDESQSHVSGQRVIRLTGIFNRQIEDGRVQVIALSHRRDEFQSLNAMNYDVARREAYHPDDP